MAVALGPNSHNTADALVSAHQGGSRLIGPVAVADMEVGMTDTAVLKLHEAFARRKLRGLFHGVRGSYSVWGA